MPACYCLWLVSKLVVPLFHRLDRDGKSVMGIRHGAALFSMVARECDFDHNRCSGVEYVEGVLYFTINFAIIRT